MPDSLRKLDHQDPYVFGPVPSRRLGLSLGVDLVPPKTCTYDCLYCEVGRTTCRCAEPAPLVPVEAVILQVSRRLRDCTPNVVTLAGSGEPTLHAEIHRVIEAVGRGMGAEVAVLTNGSLLWRREVRERLLGAHKVLPTLTSGYEETFRKIHRPHPSMTLARVLEGLSDFRKEYRGEFLLEVVFLAGINDTDREVERLREVIRAIGPDRVQLNTVARPPADPVALALDMERLGTIRSFLGNRAEIIVEFREKRQAGGRAGARELLEMIRRRPVRAGEAGKALGLEPTALESLIQGLLQEGRIREEVHLGTTFYVLCEKDVFGGEEREKGR